VSNVVYVLVGPMLQQNCWGGVGPNSSASHSGLPWSTYIPIYTEPPTYSLQSHKANPVLVMTVFEQSLRMGFECISISIYLRSELTLIHTKVLSARCPTTCDPEDSIVATFLRTQLTCTDCCLWDPRTTSVRLSGDGRTRVSIESMEGGAL